MAVSENIGEEEGGGGRQETYLIYNDNIDNDNDSNDNINNIDSNDKNNNDNNDNDNDLYIIGRFCLCVCLFVTKNDHFT